MKSTNGQLPRWSPAELEILRVGLRSGSSISQIASELGRTAMEVRGQIAEVTTQYSKARAAMHPTQRRAPGRRWPSECGLEPIRLRDTVFAPYSPDEIIAGRGLLAADHLFGASTIDLSEPSGAACMPGGDWPCGLDAGAPPVPVSRGPVGPCGCIMSRFCGGRTVRPVLYVESPGSFGADGVRAAVGPRQSATTRPAIAMRIPCISSFLIKRPHAGSVPAARRARHGTFQILFRWFRVNNKRRRQS
jgi:hypothetical protein